MRDSRRHRPVVPRLQGRRCTRRHRHRAPARGARARGGRARAAGDGPAGRGARRIADPEAGARPHAAARDVHGHPRGAGATPPASTVGFDLLIAHASTNALGLANAGIDAPLAFVYHSPTARELRTLRPARFPASRDRVTSYGLAPALGALERWSCAGRSASCS